ncbi:MAG: ATP-binding cassette domain-containing protein [Rhodocyclaceae bacterium]|nr:ATP-binding cassette domain-containing protein [Rhodocyclaceae bacterium]
MPILTLENASLAFGHFALLDHADFVLEDGERVALIGRNGTGKSSLLAILAGQAQLDDGRAWRREDAGAAFVAQEPVFEGAQTVFQAVAQGLGRVSEMLVAYHDAARRLSEGEEALDELHDLQAKLEAMDAWRLETRVEQAVSQLGLSGDAAVSTLSGGNLKRLALARALVSEPGLLLLDEPTNHLDLEGIRWLEELLLGFKGGAVVVTHDRRFLDRIATRVVELDRGRLASFPGNFATYQKRKADLLSAEAQQSAKFDKFLAQEEVWIRKGVEARRTRNEGRVLRLEALRRERAARRERLGTVNLAVARGDASGKMVAELEGVSKSFGQRVVVRDFSCRIQRGDHVGIIGPNGAGKTTLLKLILGELSPDAGTVRLGTKLTVAYFDQFRAALDDDAALVDVISPGSDYVEIGGARKHVISYLEDFLFAPERARSPVRSLSGGERARLLLARLFAKPANVIVLDEPTNDLDIETLELLESLLQEYAGTVFLVSHDRTFLDNVVTQVIAAEGEGGWKEYVGGFDDWERQRPRPTAAVSQKAASVPRPADAPKKTAKSRLSFNENRELAALPDRIAALEAEQVAASTRLADPALYRDAPADVGPLKERLAALEDEILAAMERWEALETKAAG